MRSQGESSRNSRLRQLICTARNTRSGCGIKIVARPSFEVKPVSPAGEPFGLAGYRCSRLALVVDKAQDWPAPCSAVRLNRTARGLRRARPRSASGCPPCQRKTADGESTHFDHDQPGFESRAVGDKSRPVARARNDALELRHHLAAIADAQLKVSARVKNPANCSASCALNKIDLAQPPPAPSTSP